MTNMKMIQRAPQFGILALVAALALSGCGGSSGSNLAATRGTTKFTIKWPEPTSRVVPTASQSIVITLSRTGFDSISSGPLDRTTTTWTSPQVESGDWTVLAEAFPETDGTGVLQARGNTTATVVPSASAAVNLVMGTTVTTATILGPTTMTTSESLALTAEFTDATGATVLVDDATTTWSSLDTTLATIAGTGTAASVTGLRSGDVTVRIRFNEVETSLGQVPIVDTHTIRITALAANTPWSKFGKDLKNSGRTNVPGVNNVQQWRLPMTPTPPFNPVAPPVVGPDGTIYTVANSNELIAAKPDTGDVIFRVPCNGRRLLLAAGNVIYYADNDGLKAVNSLNGIELWAFAAPTPMGRQPMYPSIGNDGFLYWGTGNQLFKIDPETQAVSYTLTLDGNVGKIVAIDDDGTLYVGTDNGTLFSINSADGSTKWTFDNNIVSGDRFLGGVSIGPDLVYVTSDTGFVHGVFKSNGVERWNVQFAAGMASTPAVGSDGRIFVLTSDNKLVSISNTGGRLWETGLVGSSAGAPVIVSDGSMYVGVNNGTNANGVVYRINQNGGTIWTFATFGRPAEQVAVTNDGTLYIASTDNSLYSVK
jgi:outer membrane protein assembly factor BamB